MSNFSIILTDFLHLSQVIWEPSALILTCRLSLRTFYCTNIFWGLPDLECNFQYYFATLYSKESNWIWRRALSDRLSRWYKKPVSTIFTSCLSGMKTFLVARGVSVRPLEYKVFRGGGGNCTPTFHTVQIFRVIN